MFPKGENVCKVKTKILKKKMLNFLDVKYNLYDSDFKHTYFCYLYSV